MPSGHRCGNECWPWWPSPLCCHPSPPPCICPPSMWCVAATPAACRLPLSPHSHQRRCQVITELETTEDMVALTLSAYALTVGFCPLLWGPLSDHYGRRIVLLACLSIFIVSAIIAGSAASLCSLLSAMLSLLKLTRLLISLVPRISTP